MAINPVMDARTKHVELDYHFVREKRARGQFLTQFVKSKDQLADIHTKALTKQVFYGFHSKLGVIVPPLISMRDVLKETARLMEHVEGTTPSK